MRPRCSFRTAPVDASRISAQTPRPPNPTPAQPSPACLPCLPCPAQPSPAQPTRPRPNRYFAANSLLQLAGRRESQQHFTPFSGRPKNHIHLTIHFPAGPEPTSIFGPPANIHFTSILLGKMDVKWMLAGGWGSENGANIHFTSILPSKMDVKWMLAGGPKMDVGFRARRKMDVGFRAPPNNGLQNGCGIYAGRATWMQNGCWDSRLTAKWV